MGERLKKEILNKLQLLKNHSNSDVKKFANDVYNKLIKGQSLDDAGVARVRQICDKYLKEPKTQTNTKPQTDQIKANPKYVNPYQRVKGITEDNNGKIYTFANIPGFTYDGNTGEAFYNKKHIGMIGGGDDGGYISHANFDLYTDNGQRYRIYSNGTMARHDPTAVLGWVEWDDITDDQRDKFLKSLSRNPNTTSSLTWRWFMPNDLSWKKQGGKMNYKNYFKEGGRFVPKALFGNLSWEDILRNDDKRDLMVDPILSQEEKEKAIQEYYTTGAGKDRYTAAENAYNTAYNTGMTNLQKIAPVASYYDGTHGARVARRNTVDAAMQNIANGSITDQQAQLLFGTTAASLKGLSRRDLLKKAKLYAKTYNSDQVKSTIANSAIQAAKNAFSTYSVPTTEVTPEDKTLYTAQEGGWSPVKGYQTYLKGKSWNREDAWSKNNALMLTKKLGLDPSALTSYSIDDMKNLQKEVLGLSDGNAYDQADGKFGLFTWDNNGWNNYDFTVNDGKLEWKKKNTTAFKQGGKMNKYQQGGAAPAQGGQDMQAQVAQLVQAAMSGDEQATQTINKIMEAAKQGDLQAIQIALMIQQIAQLMQGQQAQAAKRGAKLSYLHKLSTGCPEGTELTYYKKGGRVCKACVEKAKKASEGTVIPEEKCGGKAKKKYFLGGSTPENKPTNKLNKQPLRLDPNNTPKLPGGKYPTYWSAELRGAWERKYGAGDEGAAATAPVLKLDLQKKLAKKNANGGVLSLLRALFATKK